MDKRGAPISLIQAPILAVDAGGSTCRCRLYSPDGAIVSEQHGPAANFRLGKMPVQKALKETAQSTLYGSGWQLDQCIAGIGLAGVGRGTNPEAQALLTPMFKGLALANDGQIAVLGAHGGRDGAAMIIGTGQICLIKHGAQYEYLGGWGATLSDQGGGADTGRLALRAAIEAVQGLGPDSPLCRRIRRQIDDFHPCSAWISQATPADYARFAPWVFAAAKQADPVAIGIVHRQRQVIKRHATALIARTSLPFVLLGGLAKYYRPHLPRQCQAQIIEPKGDALEGAYLLAQQKYAASKCI